MISSQFIYVYNLCRLLVEQSLFPEFVFGEMLLISNKGPVSFFLNFYYYFVLMTLL